MTRHRRRPSIHLLALATVAAGALALSGCATSAASDAAPGPGLGAVAPSPPDGEVAAQGTVMDTGDSVELCLGAIAESYPPQCSGIPLENWSWEGVDGSESSGGVTWGAYAVQGTFDGETFTLTQTPMMLALVDSMPMDDPTGGKAGTTNEQKLARIQDSVTDSLGSAYLQSFPQNGYLWVDVVWDDGTWQSAADEEYGADVVVIRSALRS